MVNLGKNLKVDVARTTQATDGIMDDHWKWRGREFTEGEVVRGDFAICKKYKNHLRIDMTGEKEKEKKRFKLRSLSQFLPSPVFNPVTPVSYS
jgi:hypothetical protein